MSKFIAYIRQLVGNGKAATIGIFAFIVILCVLLFHCHAATAAEVDVEAGSSFGTEGYGAVLGLEVRHPITANKGFSLFAGTDLWGNTVYENHVVYNNWDWHAGVEACKWRVCAFIGPAFVQRVDAINGAHTNYHLGFDFLLSDRWRISIAHISDAGTSNPNIGRQALLISYRLQ